MGDTNSVMKTLGSRWNCLEDRSEDDYYATDPKAIDCLLKVAKPFNSIWECACGEGHLSKRLIEYGFDVYSPMLIQIRINPAPPFPSKLYRRKV